MHLSTFRVKCRTPGPFPPGMPYPGHVAAWNAVPSAAVYIQLNSIIELRDKLHIFHISNPLYLAPHLTTLSFFSYANQLTSYGRVEKCGTLKAMLKTNSFAIALRDVVPMLTAMQ